MNLCFSHECLLLLRSSSKRALSHAASKFQNTFLDIAAGKYTASTFTHKRLSDKFSRSNHIKIANTRERDTNCKCTGQIRHLFNGSAHNPIANAHKNK